MVDLARTITRDRLVVLVQAVGRDIMQRSFVKTQSMALVSYDMSAAPSLSMSSNESSWPLQPNRFHEILDSRDPCRYQLSFRCRVCGMEWLSAYGEGGQPYVDAKEAGWSKSGGSWALQVCSNPECR